MQNHTGQTKPTRRIKKAIPLFLVCCLLLATILMISYVHIQYELDADAAVTPQTDYVLILGAGLNGDQVSKRLQMRLDTAVSLLQDNSVPIIVSGGQGEDEWVSEAYAMKAYLLQKGIVSDRILLEDQSVSTQENVLFSSQLMDQLEPKVLIVTSDFHIYRAKMLAARQGWAVSAHGAPTPSEGKSKSMFREVLALVKDFLVRK